MLFGLEPNTSNAAFDLENTLMGEQVVGLSVLFDVAIVKIQTIELIAKLIKNNQQNELVQKEYATQKVKEYADDIVQLSSEILGLLDSHLEREL